MTISSSTAIADTVKLIRDDLRTNVTDPISSARTGNSGFIMTSYPAKDVQYPLITVRHIDTSAPIRSGLQSEVMIYNIVIEIRIWGRNAIEADKLFDAAFNRLRINQFGTNSTTVNKLHDFRLLSTTVVDIPREGKQEGFIRTKLMEIGYIFLTED